jgi:hypothetical protein
VTVGAHGLDVGDYIFATLCECHNMVPNFRHTQFTNLAERVTREQLKSHLLEPSAGCALDRMLWLPIFAVVFCAASGADTFCASKFRTKFWRRCGHLSDCALHKLEVASSKCRFESGIHSFQRIPISSRAKRNVR